MSSIVSSRPRNQFPLLVIDVFYGRRRRLQHASMGQVGPELIRFEPGTMAE